MKGEWKFDLLKGRAGSLNEVEFIGSSFGVASVVWLKEKNTEKSKKNPEIFGKFG
jgi:hypothetical protein